MILKSRKKHLQELKMEGVRLIFGAGSDASISYNGTNMLINPKVVGSGILDVQGTLQTDGYKSSDGSEGITLACAGGTNITSIKNGLIVGATCL
jgi:hypothetical protein